MFGACTIFVMTRETYTRTADCAIRRRSPVLGGVARPRGTFLLAVYHFIARVAIPAYCLPHSEFLLGEPMVCIDRDCRQGREVQRLVSRCIERVGRGRSREEEGDRSHGRFGSRSLRAFVS